MTGPRVEIVRAEAPRSTLVPLSNICARCDGPMRITRDAIGRERVRCPRCDGVSKIQPHPDDALVPQGLVGALVQLPAVPSGALRCQVCAGAAVGTGRFCASHEIVGRTLLFTRRAAIAEDARAREAAGLRATPRYAPKACRFPGCGATFQPSGPRARYCEAHR